MKTDRILGIIIYLMNHDNVSASYRAERFHVSVRTIQRDMISISAIGVPIYSESGKNGGYSILPTYKIKNGEIRSEEQQMIIKALESLATSYTNDTLKTLIEKYNAIIQKEGGQKVFWDFGVTKENTDVQSKNQLLEHAIDQKSMCHLNTVMLMVKNLHRWLNHWRFTTSGMRGIFLHIPMIKNSIELIK